MSKTSEIKIVPLSALAPDPVALKGHEARLDKIDDLLASIPVHGLINALRVRPWDASRVAEAPKGKKGKAEAAAPAPEYGVIAGNRRLAALQRLRAEGGKVLGVVVTDDWPVPVMIGDEADGAAFEITAAENVQRLALSPVEEFRVFEQMARTASVKAVAAHFAVPEKRVQQRLRLAALHPEVLAALEGGKIDMAAAEAFAGEPDAERQAKYLRSVKHNYQLGASNVRQALSKELLTSTSPIAKLIGAEAYKAAGGQVFKDVFTGTTFWISPEVIDAVLEGRVAEQKAAWTAEGWSFVVPSEEFGQDTYGSPLALSWRAQILKTALYLLPDDLALERDQLLARRKEMVLAHPSLAEDSDDDSPDIDFAEVEVPEGEAEWADSPEGEAAWEEMAKLNRRLGEIRKEGTPVYSAEQKAVAGVVYFPDARHEPVIGIVRPGVFVPVELGGDGKQPVEDARPAKPAASLDAPGDATVHRLSLAMTQALQRKVWATPDMALRLAVAALHARARPSQSVPVKLSIGDAVSRRGDDEAVPLGRPEGDTFAAALDWANRQDIPSLLLYFAELVAPSVTAERFGGGFGDQERALIDHVDPSVGFDVEGYFAGVSKPVVIAAWDEMADALAGWRGGAMLAGQPAPDVPPFNPAGKKADMAAAAVAAARLTGWRPPQLRTPSYAGPKPAPVAVEAEEAPRQAAE